MIDMFHALLKGRGEAVDCSHGDTRLASTVASVFHHSGGRCNRREQFIHLLASVYAPAYMGLWLFSIPAAAQSQTGNQFGKCYDEVAPPVQKLLDLLAQLQDWGIAIGLSLAVIGVIVAGIYAVRGDWDRARRLLVRIGAGVAIILLAQGIIQMIAQTLCS